MVKANLKTRLVGILKPDEIETIYRSYDIAGDIAIIRIPAPSQQYTEMIAETIMEWNKSVRTVLLQAAPVSGDLRLRRLEWITGDRRTRTCHKEYGCLFNVDLAQCYFSPRLSFERIRLAQLVHPGEVVVNMFAGVGCYSIIVAKHSQVRRIYSIDINPLAVRYMRENVKLNGVEDSVVPVEGDARLVIQEKLRNAADRVLMPLPSKASEYLAHAILALKPTGGYIHYYDFEYAAKNEDPIEKVRANLSDKLRTLNVDFALPFSRVVRQTGPHWYQLVVDVKVIK